MLPGPGDDPENPPVAGRTDCPRVSAWERDPWLLRLFLARRELVDELTSGRLRLVLGIDLLSQAGVPARTVAHPLLERVYAGELALFSRGVGARRATLCAGGLFVEQVRRALEARGLDLWTLEVERLAAEELARTMRRFRPELVVAINYTEGLAEFCHEHGAKLVVWEVDPATAPPRPVRAATDDTFLFTYRRANVAAFRSAGFVHVEHLPLAADPDVRCELELDPDEARRLAAPFALVGSSLVQNASACRARFLRTWRELHGGRGEEAEELLRGVLAEQRADYTRFLVPELLEARAPGLRAAALAHGAEDPALLAGEMAASEKRLSWAANLGRLGLSVWGDAGWRALEEHGVRYRGPAGHREELTRIYNACPLHWDVGRIYQPDIVTMRVFDVSACGRLVLAEHSPALEELFEVGVEVESYRGLNELRAKVVHYLEHPEEAERIARRGQAAVRTRHSIARRVEHMLSRTGMEG